MFKIALLLLFGSCTQNEVEEIALSKKQNVVVATIEGQKTRLSVDYDNTANQFNLSWSTGDAFKVFGGVNPVEYTWSQGDEFTTTTTPEDPTYAVYPSSANPSINGTTVSMTLSATPSVANINLPIWADASNGNAFSFKHLAAALQFKLNQIPEGYNKLIVEASNAISGSFTAKLDDETPILESTSTDDADKKVTVSFEAATSGTKDQDFYIPLPVGTYTSLAVSVSNGTETKALKSWENLTIVRGKMYYTTATVDVASADAVNVALANVTTTPTTVNLTEEIIVEEGDAIEIPDEAEDVTLNFEAAPTTTVGTPLVINQNEEAASGTATSELNIKMPADAEGLHATINAPTTTVTLVGGTYESIEATTATNTLIIGEGVTIKKLVLKGGNVILKGNVESIESEVATTITITLDKDITLNNSMTFSKGNVTVELNGKEIKCASSDVFVVTDGTLTIDGEGLVYGSEANEGNSCAVWVNGANAKAIIKNGTYKVGGDIKGTTDQRNDCIYVGRDGGTIEIYGGVFEYTGGVKDGSINDGSRFLVNQNNDNATQLITIYGGTFHNFDPANAKTDEPWMTDGVGSFVAAGYSSVAGENDTYVVEEGILNETALKGAIVNGAEITLGANMTIAKAITIPTGITATINLNGFDVTAPNTDAFEVQGTLTIIGTEESVVSAGTDYPSGGVCAVWAHNGGNVTINGGYYKVYKDAEGKRNDCIYAGSNSKGTAGTIVINGGKFEYASERNTSSVDYNGDLFLLNCANSQPTSKITVNGGSFKNHVPSKESNGTENEVVLGGEKNVYNDETKVEAAHSGDADIWYEVR